MIVPDNAHPSQSGIDRDQERGIPMNCMVTGGAGLSASHTVDARAARGDLARRLSDLNSGNAIALELGSLLLREMYTTGYQSF